MFIKLYIIALPIFLLLDVLWVGLVAKNFYREQIGFLLKSQASWLPAIIFYLIFILGLVVFVLMPAVEKDSFWRAITLGLLFGLVTYATYDLTNQALTKDWPVVVTIVDLLWGACLSAIVAGTTFLIAQKLGF